MFLSHQYREAPLRSFSGERQTGYAAASDDDVEP
jgi:hypothetical protein